MRLLLFLYMSCLFLFFFFFSSRRRHTRFKCDWSSDVCSSDLSAWRSPPARGCRRDRASWFSPGVGSRWSSSRRMPGLAWPAARDPDLGPLGVHALHVGHIVTALGG